MDNTADLQTNSSSATALAPQNFDNNELNFFAQVKRWCHETLVTLGRTDIEDKIHLSFNNSFTARMGDASRYRGASLYSARFSRPLWPHASEKDRRETVVHEICHLVDMANGTFSMKTAHGNSWKTLMLRCGVIPERLSNVEIPEELKRNVTRHKAKCPCRSWELTSHLRTKICNGKNYICPKCRNSIQLL